MVSGSEDHPVQAGRQDSEGGWDPALERMGVRLGTARVAGGLTGGTPVPSLPGGGSSLRIRVRSSGPTPPPSLSLPI